MKCLNEENHVHKRNNHLPVGVFKEIHAKDLPRRLQSLTGTFQQHNPKRRTCERKSQNIQRVPEHGTRELGLEVTPGSVSKQRKRFFFPFYHITCYFDIANRRPENCTFLHSENPELFTSLRKDEEKKHKRSDHWPPALIHLSFSSVREIANLVCSLTKLRMLILRRNLSAPTQLEPFGFSCAKRVSNDVC